MATPYANFLTTKAIIFPCLPTVKALTIKYLIMKDFTLFKWRGLRSFDSSNRNNGPEFENVKNPFKRILNFKLIFLFLFGLFLVNPILAQDNQPFFDLPDQDRCTSKDLEVVQAELDLEECFDCEEGEIIEAELKLSIFNKTGSVRTSFAFWGTLVGENSEGETTTFYITGCKGPVPPNSTTTLTFEELVILDDEGNVVTDENDNPLNKVQYTCGTVLTIEDLYLAWTDASTNDNRQCPLESSTINPKCGTLDAIVVNTPLFAEVESITDVSCNGGSDGAIDITVIGGEAPFKFNWADLAGTDNPEDRTGLSAGFYSVTVTDANQCTETLSDIEVKEPDLLDADVSSTDATCFDGSDGSITITNPTGGSGDYEYSIDGGASWQASGSFTNLSADSYNVQIRDANAVDCVITLDENLVIDEPGVLDADVASEDVSCKDGSDGSITISNPTGGSGNYEYSIDGGTSWQASGSFTGLLADSYNVQIRDTEVTDCIITLDNNLVIDEPEVLDADVDSEDIACNGEAGGSITISNATGGSGNYEYSIDGGANWQASGSFTSLPADSYNVQIRDADAPECVILLDDDLEIEQPFVLTADVASTDVTCFEGSDGSITITNPSGGSGDFEYSIDGGTSWQSSGSFTGLVANSYNVQIRDANTVDCVITLDENLVIDEPDVLDADVASEDVSCNDGSDGSITISNPTGGSGDYEYSIDGGASWQASGSFTGLSADSYIVQIRDENAVECVITLDENLSIDEPDVLDADVDSEDVSCTNNGGSIIISNPSGGSGEYEFSIDGGLSWQMSGTFNLLSGGFYNVQIRDKNNPDCVIGLNNNLEIVDPGFPGGDLEVKDVTCFGASDGSITVTVSGGVPPYKVNGNVVDETNIFVLDGLPAGFYGVTIEDSNGCALVIDDVEIKEPDQVTPPEFDQVQADCLGGPGGLTFKNLDPGVVLFYSLDDAEFVLYDGTISLAVGMHTIAVKFGDDDCVSDDIEVEIKTPQPNDPFTLVPEITQPDCDTLEGTIKIRVGDNTEIDTGFFNYTVSAGGTIYYDGVLQPADGFVGLPPGNYVINGVTSDGCNFGEVEVVLENPICEEFEGCTLGYWKNHTDRWECYSTCTLYGEVFTNAPSELSDLTLLEVLNLGGGGIYNLGRQSVAALLNTCHGDINYEILSTDELIAYVNANFNNAGAAGSYLDELNNAGCTLGGSRATTAPSEGCDAFGPKPKPGKNNKAGFTSSFKAYPVPFRESLNIQYEFNYKSDVSIEFFDLQGRLLRTYKARKVSKGDVTNLDLDFATRSSQVYIIKVKTNREVFTKNIISDK